jgi:hypothetical protein
LASKFGKVLQRYKKNWWKTIALSIINANLHTDFKTVEKNCIKIYLKNISAKVKEIWPFSIFIHGHKIGWVITFLGNIFITCSPDF